MNATVKTVDKCVGREVHTKSVRTQFDPINVVNPELLQNQNSRGDILKVKIKLPQGRTKAVNTDLSFPTQAHVQFFVSFDEDDNDSTGDDDDNGLCDDVPASSRETEHKDPLYEPENQYSSTSDEEDFDKENCFAEMETAPASEPKFLVFCFLVLFGFLISILFHMLYTK